MIWLCIGAALWLGLGVIALINTIMERCDRELLPWSYVLWLLVCLFLAPVLALGLFTFVQIDSLWQRFGK